MANVVTPPQALSPACVAWRPRRKKRKVLTLNNDNETEIICAVINDQKCDVAAAHGTSASRLSTILKDASKVLVSYGKSVQSLLTKCAQVSITDFFASQKICYPLECVLFSKASFL